MHTKHANTLFPDDPVEVFEDGSKTASPTRGTVLDVDSGMELVHVKLATGEAKWVSLQKVRKI